MKTTNLTIIRHAESALNKLRANTPVFFENSETRDLFRNTPDHTVPITPHGSVQATQTGIHLSTNGIQYDVAVHTGYTRTKQTLEQIMKSVSVSQIRENIAFRERENGYAYAMTKDEVTEHFPWNERYWETFGQVFARPIGGENLMDVHCRVKPALQELIEKHEGKNILLVTHGRVISIIRFILEDWSLEKLELFLGESSQGPTNCGVTAYMFDAERSSTLISYNQKYW